MTVPEIQRVLIRFGGYSGWHPADYDDTYSERYYLVETRRDRLPAKHVVPHDGRWYVTSWHVDEVREMHGRLEF